MYFMYVYMCCDNPVFLAAIYVNKRIVIILFKFGIRIKDINDYWMLRRLCGCNGLLIEYRIRTSEGVASFLTLSRPTASIYFSKLLTHFVDSQLSFLSSAGLKITSSLREEGLYVSVLAVVCLLGAPRVRLSVRAGNIMSCSTISSCQSASTFDIVTHCCAWVPL